MFTVTSINKQGNKIIDYTCTNGETSINLTKEQLVDNINNKLVTNARIQIYKEQVIIRVDLEGAVKKTRKKRDSTSRESSIKNEEVGINELMEQIAREFGIKHIIPYRERFLEKNPTLRGKVFNSSNQMEKIKVSKLIVKFWGLVANKQTEQTVYKLTEQLSNAEYKQYCKENNIEYSEMEE